MTDLGSNTPSGAVEGFGTPFRPESGDAGLDAAVSRFVELSDAAGNPGTPTSSGAVVHAGEPLAPGLNRLGTKLDAIAAQLDQLLTVPVVPVPAGVRSIVIGAEPITRYDAEARIHRFTGDPDLAARIAEALYGPTTDTWSNEAIPVSDGYEKPAWCICVLGNRHLYPREDCPVHGRHPESVPPTEGDEPRCGATLDQGCNATSDVHRCTHTATTYAHALTDGRPHHVCECGTRWPIEGDG